MSECETRLLAHWNETARTGRRARGRAWYPAARAWADALASETGYTLEQVVAVLAITSPSVQLETNMTWTEEIMRGERESAGRFPNTNAPKIANVLADSANAAEYVTGAKVTPFLQAILGDTSALVLDRWAIFAATGERGNSKVGKIAGTKRRVAVDTAYHTIARLVGLSVRDFQASIWIHVRETTPNARYGHPTRLSDITA